MPLAPETLRKVLDIVKEDDEYVRAKDVARLFAILATSVREIGAAGDKKLSTAIEKALSKAGESVQSLEKRLSASLSESSKATKSEIVAAISQSETRMDKKTAASVQNVLTDLDALWELVRSLPSFDDIKFPAIEPDSPETVRDKLASLEGDDRLDVSAIKGLDDLSKRLAARSGTIITQQRGAVQHYDISSQLNGVKTTFALPAFSRVVLVQSTSFPTAFRPTVDFTTDASAMTLTFTSQIDPATTLAEGQSIIILYVEN